jgi:hypothetical protein
MVQVDEGLEWGMRLGSSAGSTGSIVVVVYAPQLS